MIVVFYLFSLGIWRYNFFDGRDWLWLRKVPDVMSNREQNVPEAGRYNAGQKLLFYSIIACLMGLLLSGIVIWRVYFSAFFPIGLIRLASLLHAFCAFVLICSIAVHVYMAIWEKGSMRAMTRGRVSLGWAWKNHRAWFREVTRGIQQR
jgi:formate dehydrogenase subunit gamma